MNTGFFQFLAMASSAYVAHYNAPKIWSELMDPSKERYNLIVNRSFTIAAALYISLMAFGYLTFGASSSGLILNNYAAPDMLAAFARFATGFGVLCGYPLSFLALRDNIMDLFGVKESADREKLRLPATLALLTIITAAAANVRNVGVVVGMSGALIGTLLIFILPAMMNLQNSRFGLDWVAGSAKSSGTTSPVNSFTKFSDWTDTVVLGTGIGIGIFGFLINLRRLM
jgi:amino acid permease